MSRRSANFTHAEVESLLSIIKEHSAAVASKKSDKITAQMKDAAWTSIAQKFNAEADTFRSQNILKKKYENLKMDAKMRRVRGEKYMYGTEEDGPIAEKMLRRSADEKIITFAQKKHMNERDTIYEIDKKIEDIKNFADKRVESCADNRIGKLTDKDQMKQLKTLHQLQITQSKELHQQQMSYIQLQMNCFKEKHEIEMQILRNKLEKEAEKL